MRRSKWKIETRPALWVGMFMLFLWVTPGAATVLAAQEPQFVRLTDQAPLTMADAQLDDNPAAFVLESKTLNQAVLSSSLDYCIMKQVLLSDNHTYDQVILPGAGSPAAPGEPNIRGYSHLVRIPSGAGIELIVDNIDWVSFGESVVLDPVQPPFPDVAHEDGSRPADTLSFEKQGGAYARDGFSEILPVVRVKTVTVRGKQYALITYRPLDYNPAQSQIRFAVRVDYRLLIARPETRKVPRPDQLSIPGLHDPNEIDIRSGADISAESPDAAAFLPVDTVTAASADYLIITADALEAAVAPLAAWKKKKGYQVYTANLTEVGSTSALIQSYIETAYASGTVTAYVLLVGDHELLPADTITGHPYHGSTHDWVTDLSYACVDGADNYPDLVIGRLPGDDTAEITNMVNKILAYEKTPPSSDRFGHVLLAGQFQDTDDFNLKADRMFMEDLNRIGDFLGPDYDFFSGDGDAFNKGFTIHTALQWDSSTGSDLEYVGWSYPGRITPPTLVPAAWKDMGSGDATEIAQAINDGVSIVVHRDHGYSSGSGWADPHYTSTNVDALTNGTLMPVVFSLNCATGWFDSKDSFAESWMENTNGGAVGFTGAVRISYSGWNDSLHAGIFDAFWDDYDQTWTSSRYPVSWRPASAMNRAKDRLFSGYGASNSYALLTARMFNWFGDPEMELRTSTPASLAATHPATLDAGVLESFTVRVRADGVLLSDARVALVAPDGGTPESHVVYTDSNGAADFSVTLQNSGTYKVTVTEHNSVPYEGTITAVVNLPPNADAGIDQIVDEGDGVTLDGTDSEDTDGTITGWAWTQTQGPTVDLSSADSSTPTFDAPRVASDTELIFELTVTDNNNASDSDTCSIFVQTTNAGLPMVTTQAVSDIGYTTATGNGSIIELGIHNPTAHGVCYGLSPNPTASCTDEGGVSETGTFTTAITGLDPGTTYYARAYATNTEGTVYGDDVTFTTDSRIPAVTTQSVSDVSYTTASITGNITDLGMPNATVHGVCYGLSANPATTCTDEGVALASGEFTSDLSGLDPGTMYHARAYATNSQGTSYGADIIFTTQAVTLPTVMTGSAANIGEMSAVCSGEVTHNGGEDLTACGICWATQVDPTLSDSVWQGPVTGNGVGSFSGSITSLKPGTTYYFRAFATNSAGTAYGSSQSFKTASDDSILLMIIPAITKKRAP